MKGWFYVENSKSHKKNRLAGFSQEGHMQMHFYTIVLFYIMIVYYLFTIPKKKSKINI